MNRNILTIVITAISTSVVWLLIIFFVIRPHQVVTPETLELAPVVDTSALRLAAEDEEKQAVSYEQDILGYWKPVEESHCELDFSAYGTLKTLSRKGKYKTRNEYKYRLDGDKLAFTILTDFYEGAYCLITIDTNSNGSIYLTIFEDPELGGRYIKTSK